jgi:hypothetical protein
LSQNDGAPSRRQPPAQRGEPVAHAPQGVRVRHLAHPELELPRVRPPRFRQETLARALEREPLVIEQRLDPLHQLEIATTVETLPGRILLGAQ